MSPLHAGRRSHERTVGASGVSPTPRMLLGMVDVTVTVQDVRKERSH